MKMWYWTRLHAPIYLAAIHHAKQIFEQTTIAHNINVGPAIVSKTYTHTQTHSFRGIDEECLG